MIPYASQTSGPNRRAIEAAGWRQFVSPATRAKNGQPTTAYAIDNGAWSAFLQCVPWQPDAFVRLVDELGERSDFIVVPDVVRDRERTLELANVWLPRLRGLRLYLAVQDGMGWMDVDPLRSYIDGLFIGGSTAWKWSTINAWGLAAKARALPLHVGRVNSAKRIRDCWNAGAGSFDGSQVSRYAEVKLPPFDAELKDCMRHEVRQTWLF